MLTRSDPTDGALQATGSKIPLNSDSTSDYCEIDIEKVDNGIKVGRWNMRTQVTIESSKNSSSGNYYHRRETPLHQKLEK